VNNYHTEAFAVDTDVH